MSYTVKTNTGKEWYCKAFQVNTISATEHELIMEVYMGSGEAGSRKLVHVSNKPRQATDPERCTSLGVYNLDTGDLVTSLHTDGSAAGTPMHDTDEGEQVVEGSVSEDEKNAPRDKDGLRSDGPTLKEYIDAGYTAESYPPTGYADKRTTDEKATQAVKDVNQSSSLAQQAKTGTQINAEAQKSKN